MSQDKSEASTKSRTGGHISHAPRPLIEHQGVQYAHFDEMEREHEIERNSDPYDTTSARVIPSCTTLTNVRWRSDRGWTTPHDVTIEGVYTMHTPGHHGKG